MYANHYTQNVYCKAAVELTFLRASMKVQPRNTFFNLTNDPLPDTRVLK